MVHFSVPSYVDSALDAWDYPRLHVSHSHPMYNTGSPGLPRNPPKPYQPCQGMAVQEFYPGAQQSCVKLFLKTRVAKLSRNCYMQFGINRQFCMYMVYIPKTFGVILACVLEYWVLWVKPASE